MTDDITSRAQAALEGVTEGEWTYFTDERGAVITSVSGPVCYIAKRLSSDVPAEADARFIAAARTLVPELLAEVQRWQFRCGQAICNLQLREIDVEQLRSALADTRITVHKFQQEVGVDLLGLHQDCGPDEVAGAVTGMRLSRDAWRENAEAYEWTGGEVARLRETEIAPLQAEVERLRGALDRVEKLAEKWLVSTAWDGQLSVVDRSFGEALLNVLRGDQ